MSLSLLLLLLLVCSTQASHFYGTVMTYYPKNTNSTGAVTVVLRYKISFHKCSQGDTWDCASGNCGDQTISVNVVDQESDDEWCQREGILTTVVPSNAPFQLQLDGNAWINNRNGISSWRASTLVELRNRSDTGRANRSPQTTVLPAVRVPSNCPRAFNLLAFDPDGDVVRCRFGSSSSECNPCNPPSVLLLSTSCTLTFNTTSSSNEGSYVVQLVMEDFPRDAVTLTQTDGLQTNITTNNSISKLPVQFAVKVDPAVPSCTEGVYLPRFLPPTPANRAQLYAPANQTLNISISAEANVSTVSELLFSGPYNMIESKSGAGQFVLTWTPSVNEDGEDHPVCFVVQAELNSSKYHSELRCVIVRVGNYQTTTTTPVPTTTTSPPTTTPLTTTTTAQTTTTSPTTTPLNTTTTAQTTTTSPPTTTPLTTTTTAQTTTTSPTTTPLNTTTTAQTTTTSPPTTTPLTTTTTAQTTTTSPTTTPLTTTTTEQTTTTSPPTTTPLTTTTTTQTTTTSPSTTTPEATTPSPTPSSNQVVIALRIRLSSATPLSNDDIRNTIIQQIKAIMVQQGLPSDIVLTFVRRVE